MTKYLSVFSASCHSFFISVIYCIISLPVIVSALSSQFIFVFLCTLIPFGNGWLYLCLTISQEECDTQPTLCQALCDTFVRLSLHSPAVYGSWILNLEKHSLPWMAPVSSESANHCLLPRWQGGKAVTMTNMKTWVMIEIRGFLDDLLSFICSEAFREDELCLKKGTAVQWI